VSSGALQLGEITPSQPWQHPEYPALGTGEVAVNARVVAGRRLTHYLIAAQGESPVPSRRLPVYSGCEACRWR
jgi:hypothetical protein